MDVFHVWVQSRFEIFLDHEIHDFDKFDFFDDGSSTKLYHLWGWCSTENEHFDYLFENCQTRPKACYKPYDSQASKNYTICAYGNVKFFITVNY